MATVASLIVALQVLDPELPVGALRAERHGEMHSFHLNDVVELHTVHDLVTGVPSSAWMVTGLPTADTPAALRRDVPMVWTAQRDGCGCPLALPVYLERRISTLAVGCAHYQPSENALRAAELFTGE